MEGYHIAKLNKDAFMKIQTDMILQQVKRRIFDEGDLQAGLFDIYQCISDAIPADKTNIVQYDNDHKVFRIVAQATGMSAAKTNFMYELPDEIMKILCSKAMPELYIMNQPEKDPVGKYFSMRAFTSDWSVLIINYKNEVETYGAIVLWSGGRDKFTPEHGRLLTRLKAPLRLILDAGIADNRKKIRPPFWKEPVEDKNEFFRQATRQLCGQLDLNVSVNKCLQYLSRFMPADALLVTQLEAGLKTERVYAEGYGLSHLPPEHIISWAPERPALENLAQNDILIINEPERWPALRPYFKTFGTNWSGLIMSLVHENRPFGQVLLALDRRNSYTEEHKELLALLHDPFALALSNNIKHREVIRLKNMIAQERKNLQEELHFSVADTIIGAGSGLKEVMENARLVAGRDSPVLLSGETGAGKEIIANFIHGQSSRKDGPFIKVNCGAIPDTLVDSELFGHKKGAFTGAVKEKKGRFERANRGTIFLDEIAELPLPAQVRMLRVLQHKIIERVGSPETIPVDIRIIAATHRNLEELVASGKFREDLWFRLNVFPIRLPPVRSRKEDIPALVDYFIEKKCGELKFHERPVLSPDAMGRLVSYDWPGNVRELENVIERELILNKSGPLTFQNLSPMAEDGEPSDRIMTEDEIIPLDDVFARHVKKVLALTDGRINGPGGAAELLGMNHGTLRSRMKKLGIVFGRRKA
jgi:transcriptional regulator with GAF, ATPase, and Fis domain